MVTFITDKLLQQTLDDVSTTCTQEPSFHISTCFSVENSNGSEVSSFVRPVQKTLFIPKATSVESCSHTIVPCSSDIKTMDSCGSLSVGVASLAVSPTQVPPAAKRLRRSASIPGDVVSGSRYHRRGGRNRQSNALVRPSVVHPDIFMADSNHSHPDESSQLSANSPSEFSGLNTLKSLSNIEAPSDSVAFPKPLSFRSGGSGCLPCPFAAVVTQPCLQISNFVHNFGSEIVHSSLKKPQRCHSQPLTSLMRVGSLKRRREDECQRPRLDFHKMRETAIVKSESESCIQTCSRLSFVQSNNLDKCPQLSYSERLSRTRTSCNEEGVCHEGMLSDKALHAWSNTRSLGCVLYNSGKRSSPLLEYIDSISPGPLSQISSSDEDESQTIPQVFKKPVLRFTGCGSADDENSVDSFAGDIDIDLIENN